MLMYPSCAKPKVGHLVHPPVAVKACLDHPPGEGDRGSARAMLAAARQQDPCSAPKGERLAKPLPPPLIYEIASSGYSRRGGFQALELCSLPCLQRLLRRLRDRAQPYALMPC
jgi:hypothetical protein